MRIDIGAAWEFRPEIHDKGFALNNLELVKSWAQFSEVFWASPLAQELEILALNEGEIAYLLAGHSTTWPKTPVAQNVDVLALNNGRVAITLATGESDWWQTPAAQNTDVLALCNGFVVVELTINSPSWIQTDAAYRKDVLSLRDDYLPVIFNALNCNLYYSDPVNISEALCRFISAGALDSVSLKAAGTAFDTDLEFIIDRFSEVNLQDLEDKLNSAIYALTSKGFHKDAAILIARCACGMQLMTDLFPSLTEHLEALSVSYIDALDVILKAMSLVEVDQLIQHCKVNKDSFELELIAKLSIAIRITNLSDLQDDIEPNLHASPIMY